MFEPDTLATVLDGFYQGQIVLISQSVGFGNYFCYLPDMPSGVHGTLFHISSLQPWKHVTSVQIQDGKTTWKV